MTKKQFYDFALMMKKDSNILFKNEAYHNSVYLAGYVLEGYIKIFLLDENNYRNHYGHLNDGKLLERLKTFNPEFFENSILNEDNINYPQNLLSDKYNINFRYEVDKWTDLKFCEKVHNEILKIEEELIRLRLEGILNDNN